MKLREMFKFWRDQVAEVYEDRDSVLTKPVEHIKSDGESLDDLMNNFERQLESCSSGSEALRAFLKISK